VRDELAGKKGKCPQCKQPVLVPAVAGAQAARADGLASADMATLPPVTARSPLDGPTLAPAGRKGTVPRLLTQPPPAAGAGAPAELYDFLAPAQQDDELGRLGPYRILKILGAGGMGVVYLAEDLTLQRRVALKVMLPTLAVSATNRERFLREARAAAAIEHEHIIPIFQVGEDRGVPYLAMPYLKGETLEDRLQREGKLALSELLRIGRETAEGLAAAQERNLIHRDIKPANLWLEGDKERVKILDFGLARGASDNTGLTQQGAIIGTPAYMAPEQAGSKKVDGRCDLFSLGCVLYRMATGQLPFEGEDALSILMAVASRPPTSPQQLNPRLPLALDQLILRLLAKAPDDRPSSAHEVITALEAIEADPTACPPASVMTLEEVAAAPSPRPEPRRRENTERIDLSRKKRRRQRAASRWPWVIAGGSLAVTAVVVLVVVSLLRTPPSSGPGTMAQRSATQPLPLTQPVAVPAAAPIGPGTILNAPGFTGQASNVAFTRDGTRFFAGHTRKPVPHSDAVVHTWDMKTGTIVNTFEGAKRPINTIALSPDGTLLATCGGHWMKAQERGELFLWHVDAPGGKPQALEGHNSAVYRVAFSPDGSLLVSAGAEPEAIVWNVRTGKELRRLPIGKTLSAAVAFSRDGKLLATGGEDNTIQLWNTTTWTVEQTLERHHGWIHSIAFGPDDTWLASSSGDRAVRVFDLPTGKRRPWMGLHQNQIYGLALSPHGRWLASGSGDGTVKVWDPRTGEMVRNFELENCDLSAPLFLDGCRMLTVSAVNGRIHFLATRLSEEK
jgi:serine/threonine protein kinase